MVSQVAHKPALFPRLQERGIHHVLQLQPRSSCKKWITVIKKKINPGGLCLHEPGLGSPACSQAHCHGEQGNPGAPCLKQQKQDPHHPQHPDPSSPVQCTFNLINPSAKLVTRFTLGMIPCTEMLGLYSPLSLPLITPDGEGALSTETARCPLGPEFNETQKERKKAFCSENQIRLC